MKEAHEEAGEEPLKVGWVGRGTVDEGSGCAQRGGKKRMTATDIGRFCEEDEGLGGEWRMKTREGGV